MLKHVFFISQLVAIITKNVCFFILIIFNVFKYVMGAFAMAYPA